MSKAYYAAGFAQDLNLSPKINETLGFSSGTASLAVTIGELMESLRKQAANEGRDCWPLAGAEAAANFLNSSSDTLSFEELVSGAISRATYSALTEGK